MYVTKSAKLWTHAFSCSPSASLDSWDREKSRSMSLATVAGLLAFLCFVRCAIGWLKLRGAITERHTARGSGQAKKEAPSKEAESKKDYGILYLEVWSGCPFRLAICISICFTKLQILSLEDIIHWNWNGDNFSDMIMSKVLIFSLKKPSHSLRIPADIL